MTPTQQTNSDMEKITNTLAVMRMDGTTNSQRLGLCDALSMNVEWLMRSIVDECRSCGMSWQQIGDTLGVSRQAAQQRFGSSTNEVPRASND